MGLAFGGVAWEQMNMPLEPMEGLILDPRNVPLALCAGFMSALAKHESTYRQAAVGGNGRWYGLLQILPATARGYKCAAPSREGLKHGPSNLSCAVRILTVVMPRDKVMAHKDKRWRGGAADWGPMRISSKRKDISAWTRSQNYCRKLNSVRPRARP